MDRRAFISRLGLGTLAMPRAALAQPAQKVHRIGILGSRSSTSEVAGPQPREPHFNALLRGLRELGYVYGEHFVTEARGGEGKVERFPNLAAELVRLRVDVIVAPGPVLAALKQVTSTIPVVMIGAADPVGQGLAQSLGCPGGNFTGLSLQLIETTAKRLELLKELVPGAAPVAVLRAPQAGGAFCRWPNPPLESGGGSCSRSTSEMPASSRGRSRRRLARALALSSYTRSHSSTGTPGELRSWLPRAGSPPCTRSGCMSRPAG